MFTGIVEEMGRVDARHDGRFTFAAVKVLGDLAPGGSVAVNGCCLTAVTVGGDHWTADVVDETLARTTLGRLRAGDPVNLERPVRLADRLGGHLVQGHVDGVGEVADPAPRLRVRVSPAVARYLVEKGSVAVDGCSLTVVDVLDDAFTVAVIPHTAEVTTLGRLRPGDRVNVEVDVLAKYVERLVAPTLGNRTPRTGAPGGERTAPAGQGPRLGEEPGVGAPGGERTAPAGQGPRLGEEPGVGAPGGETT